MNYKKHLPLLLLLTGFFSLSSRAQTVNGIPIAELNARYIEISGTSTGKIFSSAVTIDIDFGQLDTSLGNKSTEIRDENGKAMVFKSMVDALNFMSSQGYELVQVYVLQASSGSVRYFIMKKKEHGTPAEGPVRE